MSRLERKRFLQPTSANERAAPFLPVRLKFFRSLSHPGALPPRELPRSCVQAFRAYLRTPPSAAGLRETP
jgi:hypothetical protein